MIIVIVIVIDIIIRIMHVSLEQMQFGATVKSLI